MKVTTLGTFWNEDAAHCSRQGGLGKMLPMAAKKLDQKVISNSWFSAVKHPQAPIANHSLSLPGLAKLGSI